MQHFKFVNWRIEQVICLFVYLNWNRTIPLNWTLASCSENNPFIEWIELRLTRDRLGVFWGLFQDRHI
jgi:hypothetical protein